jgi:hypothetical protein
MWITILVHISLHVPPESDRERLRSSTTCTQLTCLNSMRLSHRPVNSFSHIQSAKSLSSKHSTYAIITVTTSGYQIYFFHYRLLYSILRCVYQSMFVSLRFRPHIRLRSCKNSIHGSSLPLLSVYRPTNVLVNPLPISGSILWRIFIRNRFSWACGLFTVYSSFANLDPRGTQSSQ